MKEGAFLGRRKKEEEEKERLEGDLVQGRGKSGQAAWRRMAPFWGGGVAALVLAVGFRVTGCLEAARGVALFHGILLLMLLGALLPGKFARKPGNYADSFLAFGLETALFLYCLGTVPEFLDGGLLLLQKGGHDPYFPVWVWGGLAFRLAGVLLGLSLSRNQLGNLVWAPWEDGGGKEGARQKWVPPQVKAPPLEKTSGVLMTLVEAVEQVTWGLAGPLGDLEDVLEGLLENPDLPGETRERLERARAETRWCWKKVEDLGKLIPGEISLQGGLSPAGGPHGPGGGKGFPSWEPGRFPEGSLFLVHLAGEGKGSPSWNLPGEPEKREPAREEPAARAGERPSQEERG